MLRSRLALAIFALATFGLTAGVDAADLTGLILAQSHAIDAFRGPGLYFNLYKFVPVALLYLQWVWTTGWVDDDMKELNNIRFEMWNSIVFFSGMLGFVLLWLIPFFAIGLVLLLLADFVPLFTYIYIRNQTVPGSPSSGVARVGSR